jgi:hypothetical protein
MPLLIFQEAPNFRKVELIKELFFLLTKFFKKCQFNISFFLAGQLFLVNNKDVDIPPFQRIIYPSADKIYGGVRQIFFYRTF